MEHKEKDGGFGQYKGFIKLLIKIVVPILLLVFLYLAYTPVDPEVGSTELPPDLKAKDLWLFLAVALLLLVALFFDCNRQFISRVASIIKEHWGRMLILFFLIVGGLTTLIITFHIGPRFSIDVVLARLSSSDEIVNFKSIALGLAGIIGIILAGWRSSVAERQARVAEERRLEEREVEKRDAGRRFDERFADAVKSLSQELNETSYPAHLGAVIALRDLAIDNNNYIQRCLDILCSCNQWMEGYLEEFANYNRWADKYLEELMFENQYLCYANRPLKKNARIAETEGKLHNPVTLYHERRSQNTLQAIAYIVIKISQSNSKKHILKDINFSNKMLCGIDLSGAEIAGVNFSNTYLNGALLKGINLRKAKLKNSHLRGANLSNSQMQGANIAGSNLNRAELSEAQMQKVDMSYAQLQNTSLFSAHLQDTVMRSSQLQGANLISAKMHGADLSGAYLQGAHLNSAQLQGAQLSYTQLQGATLSRAQLQGVRIIHSDLRGAKFFDAQLQGSLLAHSYVEGAIFLRCNLYGMTIQDNRCANIVFDEISKTGHIDSKLEREKFSNDVRDNFLDPKEFNQLIGCMTLAWNTADKSEVPKGLNALQQISIVEKDLKGKWVIKPSKREELKSFYRQLVEDISKQLLVETPRAVNLMRYEEAPLMYLDDHYPYIREDLSIIWQDLHEEFTKDEQQLSPINPSSI